MRVYQEIRMIFHGFFGYLFYFGQIGVIVEAFSVGHGNQYGKHTTTLSTLTTLLVSSSSSFTVESNADRVYNALKKPSKTLSVILDCNLDHDDDDDDDDDNNHENSPQIVSLVSMQLRKIQASALHTSNLKIAEALVSEQATARGDFPGPCPVLYSSSGHCDYEKAIQMGVSGILGTHDQLSSISSPPHVAKIYQVSSPDDVLTILQLDNPENTVIRNNHYFFCVDGTFDTIQDILNVIPLSESVVIASMTSMQDDNQEIRLGKELQAMGVMSILMKGACVGDNEDIEYASFVINGLTKKRSSKFNMSGLTGSTNGHFGGIASSTITTWLRTKR
jgi:hypothetical protein